MPYQGSQGASMAFTNVNKSSQKYGYKPLNFYVFLGGVFKVRSCLQAFITETTNFKH